MSVDKATASVGLLDPAFHGDLEAMHASLTELRPQGAVIPDDDGGPLTESDIEDNLFVGAVRSFGLGFTVR